MQHDLNNAFATNHRIDMVRYHLPHSHCHDKSSTLLTFDHIQVLPERTPPPAIYARDSSNPVWDSQSLPTSIEGTEFFTNIGLESTLHYYADLDKLDPEVPHPTAGEASGRMPAQKSPRRCPRAARRAPRSPAPRRRRRSKSDRPSERIGGGSLLLPSVRVRARLFRSPAPPP